MEEAKLRTLAQVKAFLDGTSEVAFRVPKDGRNPFIERVLKRFVYAPHGRADKGVLLRYIERMTGLSRQQVTRLVRQYRKDGKLAKRQSMAPRHAFICRYTDADVALLAEMDALHGTLSGPATKKLMERALRVFGDARFERLAGISVSHLYNLRGSKPYQNKRRHWTKTNPTGVPIGQRRAPQPDGMPGYIRIDSVHQGDQDGVKGVYHINAVDCVTQMQFVATCEKISEAYLLPVIQQLLDGFPFVILGFHADNGSEYINHKVAKLLEKLRIEFTKSRPRHSNDNALAESKNASVVRKHLGYAHIPQHCASLVNAFCANFLNPYVNFHRPCFFPETITDAKGKERKKYRYKDMNTPYLKFKSLPDADTYLKPGITFEQLDAQATKMSDNDAALALNNARKKTVLCDLCCNEETGLRFKPQGKTKKHLLVRPNQNKVKTHKFISLRSDSFLYWKILGKGKPLHKLKLELPQSRSPGDILSEGEQRAIAIGSFLAEVGLSDGKGGIVFDDPVSSLDHRRRERVAKRLAVEAAQRQVIVFTHDIYFLCVLAEEAEAAGVPITTQSLTRRAEGFGIADPELPFEGKSAKGRIAALKAQHQTIAKLHKDGEEQEHRKQTVDAYRDLRLTWERAVEEALLRRVVIRFRKGVETQRLAEVVDDDDYIQVDSGMTKCSNYAHDKALMGGVAVPEPDELLADISALETWRDSIEQRSKGYEGCKKFCVNGH